MRTLGRATLVAEAIGAMDSAATAARHPVAEAQAAPRAPAVRAEEDADLVRRCLAGEPAAQRLFVERYSRFVFSVCRRRGLRPDAAEDVTQDVLIEAFRAFRGYRGEARLTTWLFTLVARRIAGYLREAARAPQSAGHPGDRGFPSPGVMDEASGIETRDRAARARQAVAHLDEPARTILTAYYLAELSVAEIAAELDLPENTVKSHLHRGRLAVRRALETR